MQLSGKTPEPELSGARVLVTGGTGFTGTNLLRKLVRRQDVDVCGIARPSSQIPADLKNTVTWYRGDVYDATVVARAMKGVHYVFHLAACFRDPGAADDEYWNVHVQSTQLLAEAAVREPGFRRFVHISTIGVHGHIERPPATENAPYNPGDVYQKTKLEGEQWIRDFAAENTLPLVVVRPAQIMGPSDRRLVKLCKLATYGICPLLDGHVTRLHFVHVDDLTDCLMLCAYHTKAEGEVFICGTPEPTNLVDTVSEVGRLLGRSVWFFPVPSRPLFLITDIVEYISELLGVEPILFRRRLAFFTKDRSFDTCKVRERLGFSCQYDTVSTIRDTVKGYVRNGWL